MAKLGEQSVGSIVKLHVNGKSNNFIVVHQGRPSTSYDSSCNGTWLLMKNIYESRIFSSSYHDYENSDIHSYLNNTFVNLFNSDIKSAIKQVKIPYRAGRGTSTTVTSGSSGLSTKVFLISYTEAGFSGSSYAPVEGAALSYFDGAEYSKRIAKLNGSDALWWLRTPNTRDNKFAWYVDSSGYSNYVRAKELRGVRPALVLPESLGVKDGFVVTGGAITGQVNIGGTMKELTGEGYINVGGTLKPIVASQINIGGVLKSAGG